MALVTAAIIGGVAAVAGSTIGAISAGKSERRARSNKNRLTGELEELEKNRQDIINPYEGVTDLSSMVSDLSSIASNPFSNLAVSTAAAEMQIEEADIALANTLDTLRATGASAGGATALARMALESKKGVSASIEQQEATNQQMRARGEESLQNIQLSEAKRVQNTKMRGAERLEDKKVSGQIYEFETKEKREKEQLNRKQSQITGAAMQEGAAVEAKGAAIAGGVSAVGNMAGAYAGALAMGANKKG
jgi:hypothetical protein